MDKTSYAVGLSFGQHLAQSKIKGLDYQSFAKGVEAMCEGKQPEIDLREAQELLNKFFTKLEEEAKAQFALLLLIFRSDAVCLFFPVHHPEVPSHDGRPIPFLLLPSSCLFPFLFKTICYSCSNSLSFKPFLL